MREILTTEDDLLKNYVPSLKEMLIGQDKAIEDTYSAFSRRRAIGTVKNQPIGVYLLAGPTGVGKTEFARSLARHMFGSEEAMVRLDMSEYMNPYDDQKLIGPPPGYIGYEEGGQLTNHILRRPYSVVLLDEIEKAHPKIFDLLLQVFNEGELRDGKGRTANFKHTIILMTSNLGFSEICEAEKHDAEVTEEISRTIQNAVDRLVSDQFTDGELKKELQRLKESFTRIKDNLKKQNQEDGALDKELQDIGKLLSADACFIEHKTERANFLRAYYEQAIEGLKQYKESTIANTYDIIAYYKDLAWPKTKEEQERVIARLNRMLHLEKEFLRRRIEMSFDNDNPDYAKLFNAYARICSILARDDFEDKKRGSLKHLRSGIRIKIIDTIKKTFRPELLGRIGEDNIINFDPLSRQDLEKILDIKLKGYNALLKERGLGSLRLSENLRREIIREGYDTARGARPLERALRRLVLVPLAEEILAVSLKKGKIIEADVRAGKIIFTAQEQMLEEGGVSHQEIIDNLRKAAPYEAGDDEVLAGKLGIDSAPKTQARIDGDDMEILRKRLEIDLPETEGLPVLDLDTAGIEKKLEELEVQIKGLDEKLKSSEQLLRKARDDQQKTAITREMAGYDVKLAVLKRQREILQDRKSGKKEKAEEKLRELTAQTKENRAAARQGLNAAFENLTLEAYEGLLTDLRPPLEAVEALAEILKQKRRSYPLLLSDSLLAQKTIVDSFVLAIARGNLPGFKDTRVLRLKLEALKDYFSLVGYFELRMREIAELVEADNVKKTLKTVVVIDFDDVKDELEKIRINPFLLGYFLRMFKDLESVSFVMTTSRRATVEDDSFDRFFSLVEVSTEESGKVLENLCLFVKDYLEKKNNGAHTSPKIEFGFNAMQTAVKIWEKYFSSRNPIEVIMRWFNGLMSEKKNRQSGIAVELRDKLEQLQQELGEVISQELSGNDIIVRLINEINAAKERMGKTESALIASDEILAYISEAEAQRGVEIDTDLFRRDERAAVLTLEEMLNKRLVGQPEAVRKVSDMAKIAKAGLKPHKAPWGAFIFAGPTGVGKTQLAQTLAKKLGMGLLRVDMSEYKSRQDLSRLIGAPPGFTGYDEGEGFLFEHMKKYPKTVIILDEIDKADPAIMNILLQVLEDGRLTSNRGNTIRFNEAFIILTTNMGMQRRIIKDKQIVAESLYDEMEQAVRGSDPQKLAEFKQKMADSVNGAAKQFFRPEFLNRLEEILVFNPLPSDSLGQITGIFLNETAQALKERQGIELKVGRDEKEKEEILKFLIAIGYTAEYGARAIYKKAIENYFEKELAVFITKAQPKRGDSIEVALLMDS